MKNTVYGTAAWYLQRADLDVWRAQSLAKARQQLVGSVSFGRAAAAINREMRAYAKRALGCTVIAAVLIRTRKSLA